VDRLAAARRWRCHSDPALAGEESLELSEETSRQRQSEMFRSAQHDRVLVCSLRCSSTANQQAHHKINNDRRGDREKERTNEGRPNQPYKQAGVQIIVQPEMEAEAMQRHRPTQNPAAHLVFRKIDRRHCEDEHVMQRDRDRRRDFVTSTYPRHPNREQCLDTPQGREAEENSDGRSESDGMRRIRDCHQRHVMLDQPPLPAREWPWQPRFVNLLSDLL